MAVNNSKVRYAGFLRRGGAIIIDTLIFSAVGVFLGTSHDTNTYQMVGFLLSLGYHVWMVGKYGATIGKMVLGIKITKLDGSTVSYSDALVRELSSYLSALVLFLGYIWVIWDPKKQSWHDKIAKTVVVYK